MEVFEDEDGGLDLFDDLVQRGQGVFGRGVAVLLGLDGSADGDDAGAVAPLEGFLLALLGDLLHHVLHPHLLARNDVEDRIARPDEGFEFGLEVHG